MYVKMSNLKSLPLLRPFFISSYYANKVEAIRFDVVCYSIQFDYSQRVLIRSLFRSLLLNWTNDRREMDVRLSHRWTSTPPCGYISADILGFKKKTQHVAFLLSEIKG